MRPPRSLAAIAVLSLAAAAIAWSAFAQTTQKPSTNKRSIPYVSITGDDGRQRHFETNAIPLLFNRACFGWRMWVGGPNRAVYLVEVLTTSQPAEQVIAGPETEVNADKTQATTRMREFVNDGILQRSWCIIPGDPPGTYTYNITIDGEPRGEFVFCAIEVPDQNPDTDPRDLNCPNKFHSVQRDVPRRAVGPS